MVEQQRRRPATVRVAMWSARRPWLVLLVWLVATIGTFVASQALGGIKTQGATNSSGFSRTESAEGGRVWSQANVAREPGEDFLVVVTGPAGATSDPEFHAAVSDVVASLRGATFEDQPLFRADSIIDPFSAPIYAGLTATDTTSARIPARIVYHATATRDPIAELKAAVEGPRQRHPAVEMHAVSSTLINEDINDVVSSDLEHSLVVTVPATFVILLIAFGAIAAAVVPLVLALTALLAAFGLLGLYSQIVDPVSPYATQLVVLIGLAVAVDFSRFMITRYRSERGLVAESLPAIATASGTAGRAVFFSGLAVMISVAGLYALPDTLFHTMALGTLAVILVAVIGSLTFLPAVLALLGRRIDFGRIPWFGRDRSEEQSPWGRLARAVMRRPILAAIGSTVLLLALAAPTTAIRFGTTDITAFPESIDGVAAIEQLREHWPEGTLLTLDVIVTNAADPQTQTAVQKLETNALAIDGLSGPPKATLSTDGTVYDVSFVMSGTQNDARNHEIVREMRTTTVPQAFGGMPNTRAYVAGDAAETMDRTGVYTDALPLVFGFVLALSFVLLLVAFRSIVVPVKAIILNLLSTLAAYGVLVAVFELGFGKELLGIRPTDVIEAWVPIFVFAILFGLSMDYHVFILTRIRELVDRGAPTSAAVARGIAITSGTVTSAAAIMVVVFAVFATLRLVIIRELGLGLAVAVLIDATVIRSILLPATMRLLGEWNWYLPSWLGWLPRLGQLFLGLVQLALAGDQFAIALLEHVGTLVELLVALEESPLEGGHLRAARSALLIELALHAHLLVLGLEDEFLLLSAGFGQDARCLVLRDANGLRSPEATGKKAHGKGNDGGQRHHRQYDGVGHFLCLPSSCALEVCLCCWCRSAFPSAERLAGQRGRSFAACLVTGREPGNPVFGWATTPRITLPRRLLQPWLDRQSQVGGRGCQAPTKRSMTRKCHR
jgi:RND superfamily putative drug exporter